MDEKELLAKELDELEEEYRTWRVAVINLEPSIDEIERRTGAAPDTSPDRGSLLSQVRHQQQHIEAKLDRIRLQLDDMRSRLDGMS